jgi:ATP-dependent DNA helicase RecQ
MTDDTDHKLFTVLQETFGFASFRQNQQEIIQAIMAGQDVFAVMPTGGGKSLCYQLPALLLDGVCIVISPLISLMKDQVDSATALGIRAAFINSTLTRETQAQVMASFRANELDLLYLAPERLALDHFARQLQQGHISLIAVDEAHCISEWGHDFRPDYLQLSKLPELLPGIGIGAFTATATEQVAHDIVHRLQLKNPFRVRASFNRPNLNYTVRMRDNVQRQILQATREHTGQPGIVYRLSRNDVERTAAVLMENGISALPYHAGLNSLQRAKNQEAFNRDEIQVIVATVAFGMGIDKSNVRFIIHGDLPKNMEGYYQETGRAGRDGEPAECLLLYNRGDMMRLGHFLDQLQDPTERDIGWRKLKQMADYAEKPICRRRQLLAYFDEDLQEENCGGCDICLQGVEELDATTEAQMLMSAIHRSGQRFGAAHVIDIVVGAKTKKLLQFGHDKLPTHGVGKHRKKIFWRRLADAMLHDGLLRTEGGKFPTLSLTPAGEDILYGRSSYSLHLVKEVAAESRQPETPAIIHEDLFAQLRELRRKQAEEQNVPPYVIFSDKSLHDMCRLLPTTTETMLAVNGVGRAKLERYGNKFLSVIDAWLTDNPDVKQPGPLPGMIRKPAAAARDSSTIKESAELAGKGLSLEEIAVQRGLKPTTIAVHLATWIEEGNQLDIDHLVDEKKRNLLQEQFTLHGTDFLKPAVEALEGRVNYEEARIVRACLCRRK